MADNVVGIDIVARLDAFKAELGKIPDIGAKEAKALTAQLSREIRATEAASKKALAASQSAAKGARDAAKGFDAVKAAAQAGGYGDLAEKVEKLGVVAGALANPAGVAAAALVGVGVAAVAGTAALAATVFASDEALKSLEGFRKIGDDFYPSVPPETLASIEAVNASTDALGSIMDRLVVIVGANVAPAFERVASIAVGLALRLERLFEEFAEGESILRELAVFAAGQVVDALLAPVDAVARLVQSFAVAAQLAGVELPASVTEALSAFENLKQEMAEGAVAYAESSVAGSALAGVLGDLETEGGAFIQTQIRVNDQLANGKRWAEEAAKALKAYNDQLHAQETAGAAARATYDQMIEKLADLTAADERAVLAKAEQLEADHAAALQQIVDLKQRALVVAETATARENIEAEALAAIEAETAQHYAELDKLRQEDLAKSDKAAAEKAAALRDATYATAADVAGAVRDIADVVSGIAEEGTEKQKQLALVAFRISQGAAVAQAVITARKMALDAYAAALELGPAGLAIAPFAAAGAGAVGLAQVASIAATPPPSFHAGLAPDEVPATLTRGEGVLTPRGVAAAGGSEGVRRANRGEAPAATQIVVVQQYQHRVFDAAVGDNLQMPTSPLRRAIRAGRRIGHRRRT